MVRRKARNNVVKLACRRKHKGAFLACVSIKKDTWRLLDDKGKGVAIKRAREDLKNAGYTEE